MCPNISASPMVITVQYSTVGVGQNNVREEREEEEGYLPTREEHGDASGCESR